MSEDRTQQRALDLLPFAAAEDGALPRRHDARGARRSLAASQAARVDLGPHEVNTGRPAEGPNALETGPNAAGWEVPRRASGPLCCGRRAVGSRPLRTSGPRPGGDGGRWLADGSLGEAGSSGSKGQDPHYNTSGLKARGGAAARVGSGARLRQRPAADSAENYLAATRSPRSPLSGAPPWRHLARECSGPENPNVGQKGPPWHFRPPLEPATGCGRRRRSSAAPRKHVPQVPAR